MYSSTVIENPSQDLNESFISKFNAINNCTDNISRCTEDISTIHNQNLPSIFTYQSTFLIMASTISYFGGIALWHLRDYAIRPIRRYSEEEYELLASLNPGSMLIVFGKIMAILAVPTLIGDVCGAIFSRCATDDYKYEETALFPSSVLSPLFEWISSDYIRSLNPTSWDKPVSRCCLVTRNNDDYDDNCILSLPGLLCSSEDIS